MSDEYPPCPEFEVGDTLMMRNGVTIYEVAQLAPEGVLIWARNKYVAHGLCYPSDELKTMVTWVWKPDGTAWTSPPDPSDAVTKDWQRTMHAR